MRLLHTSDWHLGRGLHGVDLHQAQESMVEQIVSSARSERVDAVLICGDVFDRAVPPVASVALWSRALAELSDVAPVVVIPGNHDSATRLGVGAALYREGVHVVTRVDDIGTPIELADEHGPVLVYPLPFLDPDAVRQTLSDADEPLPRSHEAVMTAAMERIRRDVASRRAAAPSTRSVVMAHAFVVSSSGHEGERSDSERDIRVGGVDSVPSTVFDGVDYVALGHLHGTQRVDGDRLRYSGSPLRYSFSEANQHKQALLVELAADGIPTVTSLPIRQPRPMATLTGTLDELLGSPELADATEAWAQVTVTDAARPTELLARVRARFPEALVVRHVPASGPLADQVSSVTPVPSRPSEVAEAFVRYVTGGDITPAELDAFESAYERVLADARSA